MGRSEVHIRNWHKLHSTCTRHTHTMKKTFAAWFFYWCTLCTGTIHTLCNKKSLDYISNLFYRILPHHCKALNSLIICADVPLWNYSLTHYTWQLHVYKTKVKGRNHKWYKINRVTTHLENVAMSRNSKVVTGNWNQFHRTVKLPMTHILLSVRYLQILIHGYLHI